MKPPEIQVTITVLEGEDEGFSVKLKNPRSIIGRRGADIALRDRKISQQHAAIEISGSEVTIIDLESRNGITVNGKDVKHARLANLDEIQLGFSRLRVLIVEDLASFRDLNAAAAPVRPPKTTKDPDPTIARRDIGSMIDDELKRFSKWDLPPASSTTEEGKVTGEGYVLEILEGPDAGKRFRLERKGTTLGRGKADISFQDADISRLHASIDIYGKGNVVLRDLGSTNGTLVNKKRVSETRLSNGDRIQLGGTLCRFVVEG
ncbi:MAG: FHA domain-containing protein [Pseudomonadota bacterium]